MKKLIFIFSLLFPIIFFGQSSEVSKINLKKSLQTKFISAKITIDGKLDEEVWKTAPIATDFVTLEPDNGKPIAENKKTDVKVLYDNDGIYIAAVMHDDEPNKIFKEISQRDDFGSSDLFGVFVNGFNDGQQDFRFIVSASDGQLDAVATDSNGEDTSWDAVWESKAIITEYGWVVEMKIPYAALRFSGENKQTWGMNFFRLIQRDRQKYTWNFVDNKNNTFIQQAGILEGIENIKPPTRLFLLPYSSFYVNADAQNKTSGTIKGGLDIKYGINEAFTLDAVLIPDFGQTKYDDKILNLGPFEQQFNENRAFFTEGTDLFSKGDLFYSRRIGGNPRISKSFLEDNLPSNFQISEYPNSINLLNATKISGRTKGGLGIGFLNAITENTYVSLTDTTNGETSNFLIEPLTNYNILVFDQRFQNNSSVSFINTNVTRDGSFRDANVSGLVYDLKTKANTYQLLGNFVYSHINDFEKKDGFKSGIELNETSGKYRFGVGGDIISTNFDIDDLGILNETGFYDFYANASYRILNPNKTFNTFRINGNYYTEFQKETGQMKSHNININMNGTSKKNHFASFGININPSKVYDYYEPRIDGRFFIRPERFNTWFYLSTNFNYKFAIDFNPSYSKANQENMNNYGFMLSPRYRFSNKFLLTYSFNFYRQNNNQGRIDYYDLDSNSLTPKEIIFANRNVIEYTNSISGKYSLNSKMNFNLSVRQYWSFAENKNFYTLQDNGKLMDISNYTVNKNVSQNSWNFDLSYSYWFAPGSQMSVLYRNNSSNFERDINKNFGQNVSNLLTNDALSHVFSISLKYFIDYNQAKHWF
jgi:Domain of unknown function (DUF5916)/Carbohydrate family 9 binding domain-like